MNIYQYIDYKTYMNEKIDSEKKINKGLRSRLCEFIPCQSSYLSQVLKLKPNFTLEQAHRVNEFFGHNNSEARYFLLLVEYARAGTEKLKSFLLEEIQELQQSRLQLSRYLKKTDAVSKEAMHKYYSSWFYSAIHVILSLEEYKSPIKIAEYLRLPLKLVNETIFFLNESGLIESKQGEYHITKRRLHLQKDALSLQNHHINWRSQALQSVEKNLPDDFHYSSVFAISESDYFVVKEMLMKFVLSTRDVIGPSKEEAMFAMTLDLFRV